MKRFVFVGLVAWVMGACSQGDDRSPRLEAPDSTGPNGPGVGGSGGDAGSGGGSGGGGSDPLDGGIVNASGAPAVTITSPLELDDPNDGEVLIEAEVTVVCQAAPADAAGQAVDASSVEIEVLDADGDPVDVAPGVPTGEADEFSADFVITGVATGRISFRCSAADTSEPPLTGTVSISSFVDHGPTIEVSSPVADAAYALEGAVPFEFSVMPSPLTNDDPGADVSNVTLTIDGVDIDLTNASSAPGEYSLSVDLADDTLFPNAPSGAVSVLISAENSRDPATVTRTLSHSFVVDSLGPTISVTEPMANDVIGGEVILTFTVTDPEPGSGIDPSTVVVTLGTTEFFYDVTGPWTEDEGDYTFRFDSVNLENVVAQLTVNIRAADRAGNVSIGESLLLYLDNLPPVLDLDPSNVRTFNPNSEECSLSFDPVGPLAPDDEESINRAAWFRALVFDQTNESPGQAIAYYSSIDEASVRLYVQPDPSLPVIIDTNEDGFCDEVADLDNLDFVRLNPVTKEGAAVFGQGDGLDDTREPVITGGCPLAADPPTEPIFLCEEQASDMTVVISGEEAGEQAVYAVGTIGGVECTGNTWEVGGLVSEDGWICLAARALDTVGNVGISRPLRVCLDDSTRAGSPDCATLSTTPPECTDGCTPPERFLPFIVEE